MNDETRVTRKQRRYYDQLVGCTIVEVLWEPAVEEPLPVLILSVPTGGTAECLVLKDPEQSAAGYLKHTI